MTSDLTSDQMYARALRAIDNAQIDYDGAQERLFDAVMAVSSAATHLNECITALYAAADKLAGR